MSLPSYAELHCLTAFSFQRGASLPRDLFQRAAEVGYTALAITDEASVAGVVRAMEASRQTGVRLIVGSEMSIHDGPKLVFLASDHDGYSDLCRLITLARRRADKGRYRLLREDLTGLCPGLLALWCPRGEGDAADGVWLREAFPNALWIAVELHRGARDAAHEAHCRALGAQFSLPLVAAGDVHMHTRSRRALQDLLTAVRHHTTVADAGWRLFPNGERHLRNRQALSAIYAPDLLAETLRIAERCTFALDQLRYTYPRELCPEGHTPTSWLRTLTEDGARWRWPEGVPDKARSLIEHELALIAELGYEPYFLTVHDIVRFARSRGILCQGRGSAANSAVCYALGVTAIDPARMNMLFERFLSRERREPPDIDIDFEHERREEVLQYVFARYGRDRAALTAVATTYRGRSAIRDAAKALGMPPDQVDLLASTTDRWGGGTPLPEHLREHGFDPDTPQLRRVLDLTDQLVDLPRHLSQHPGGFVISEHPLSTLVPVENAAMAGRTILQWDKDDLDALGLLKVDCLALGMLTAVRKTLDALRATGRRDLTFATIPAEDPDTYAMISRADTVGTFQIESRAQLAMLPRLRPQTFYDLVIEVAIVRPGPIQGDMVHPYLRRRNGEEPIDYPADLEDVFARTLGVPLFQEQVMQLAVKAAGYSPGEADQLRRSMAAWKRHGGLEPHRERLLAGMRERGYSDAFAEKLFRQIEGFGSYGFPESHAASFALITYASCWLKCHEPAAFTCALLNSQPLGFYTPDQLLQDARRHGIRIEPIDVRYSAWDCSLEHAADPAVQPRIRLGLRLVVGFSQAVADKVMRRRQERPFADVEDLCRRAKLDARHRALLADAGALKGLSGHRHRARWDVAGVESRRPLFEDTAAAAEEAVALPAPSAFADMKADYAHTGTTLGAHPMSFVRDQLRARRFRTSTELANLHEGAIARFAGLVRMRQRPATASGVVFVTLEDEHGTVNVIVWGKTAEVQRRALRESQLLGVHGTVERQHGVQNLIAGRLENLDALLGGLEQRSREFH